MFPALLAALPEAVRGLFGGLGEAVFTWFVAGVGLVGHDPMSAASTASSCVRLLRAVPLRRDRAVPAGAMRYRNRVMHDRRAASRVEQRLEATRWSDALLLQCGAPSDETLAVERCGSSGCFRALAEVQCFWHADRQQVAQGVAAVLLRQLM